MDTPRIGLTLLAGLLCMAAPLAAATPAELLEEGLTAETAQGDLEAAMAVYQRILDEHPDAGATTARAQLHIGLCYEKLGRREARAAYESVIAHFPEEKEIVERARERLESLDQAVQAGQRLPGAGPERTRQVRTQLESQRRQVHSYRGTQAVELAIMGQTVRSAGPTLFRSPNLTRVELTSSLPTGNSIVVLDGTTMWTHQPTTNFVASIDVAALTEEFPEYRTNNSVYLPFQGMEEESICFIRRDRIDGEEVCVFQAESDQIARKLGMEQATPDWVEISLGSRDGLLRRLVGYRDSGAEVMRTEMTVDEVNVDLPDSAFVFSAPEGAQVMDMTDMIRGMYAQLAAGGADGDAEAPNGADTGTDASSVMVEIEAAREAVTTHRYKATREMQMMGTTVTYEVSAWLGGEGRSRQETTSSMKPGTTLTVQDSNVVWTYMPAMKVAHRLDPRRIGEAKEEGRDEEAGPPTFEGMLRDSVVFVGREMLEGEEVYVLEGPPPGGLAAMTGVEFGKTTLWIAVEDGLVRKQQTLNVQGEVVMSQVRTDVEVNVDLPDSLFTFTPPEDVQVMDMTEMVIKQVGQMRAAAQAAEEAGK